MRKIRNLTGMPVLCHRQKLGRLAQAQLSPDLKRLEGVWVDGGLRGARYIPAEQLGMIGEAVVIADAPGRRARLKPEVLSRRAVSTGGERLGAIVGAEVDEISFLVGALELSRGLWDDLRAGRTRVERYCADAESGAVIVLDSARERDEKEDEE